MKILIYNNTDETFDDAFQKGVHLPDSCQVTFTRSCRTFSDLSRLCLAGDSIIIFFAGSHKELSCLQSAAGYLSDVKLIIHLADDDNDLFSKALKLYPTFVSQSDGGYLNIISVVNKIIENANREPRDNRITIL